MAVSAAILAHAPAAFLSLKSPLNRNRPRDKNRTKNAEKPPFQAVFLRKMVRVTGFEPAASCSQTVELNFFWCFLIVLTISATFRSLFAALNSTVSECSGAVCGQTCGQRALLDQVRHNCRSLSRRALFHVQVWGIVPLTRRRCKLFFRFRRINF